MTDPRHASNVRHSADRGLLDTSSAADSVLKSSTRVGAARTIIGRGPVGASPGHSKPGNVWMDAAGGAISVTGPRLVCGADEIAAGRQPLASIFAAWNAFADLVILVGSGGLASWSCHEAGVALGFGAQLLAAWVATFSAGFVLHRLGGYGLVRLRRPGRRLTAIAAAAGVGGVAATLAFTLASASGIGAPAPGMLLWPLCWSVSMGGCTAAAAIIVGIMMRSPMYAGRIGTRVAVVGTGPYGAGFVARMAADGEQAATVVGIYEDGGRDEESSLVATGFIEDLVARSRHERIDAVVLALPLHDQARIVSAQAGLGSMAADIYIAGPAIDLAAGGGHLARLGPNPVVKITSRPLSDWEMLQKGAMDRIFAALMLLVLLPALLLIAAAIRLDSRGPVLFRQPRLGFNNAMFNVLKFRTMYHHLADMTADQQTIRGDKRITRIGRLLRRTSIDEIPQLINVLRGEMSLVGPRPHAPNTKAGGQLFHDAVANYAHRHRVKPGITGWAQVNGWRGETQTREQLEQRVAHDLHYIDNWSLGFDVKILMLTALRELNSKVAF